MRVLTHRSPVHRQMTPHCPHGCDHRKPVMFAPYVWWRRCGQPCSTAQGGVSCMGEIGAGACRNLRLPLAIRQHSVDAHHLLQHHQHRADKVDANTHGLGHGIVTTATRRSHRRCGRHPSKPRSNPTRVHSITRHDRPGHSTAAVRHFRCVMIRVPGRCTERDGHRQHGAVHDVPRGALQRVMHGGGSAECRRYDQLRVATSRKQPYLATTHTHAHTHAHTHTHTPAGADGKARNKRILLQVSESWARESYCSASPYSDFPPILKITCARHRLCDEPVVY